MLEGTLSAGNPAPLDDDLAPRCCARPDMRVDEHPSSGIEMHRLSCRRCGTAGKWAPDKAEDPERARLDGWREVLEARASRSTATVRDASEVF